MITLVHFRNKQYLNKYNKVSDPNALGNNLLNVAAKNAS